MGLAYCLFKTNNFLFFKLLDNYIVRGHVHIHIAISTLLLHPPTVAWPARQFSPAVQIQNYYNLFL
jgi:hypothetical protein